MATPRPRPGDSLIKAGIRPISPGVYLAERILPHKAMTAAQAADSMGLSLDTLNGILSQQRRVDRALAEKLCGFTGLSVQFWLNMQDASVRVASKKEGATAEKGLSDLTLEFLQDIYYGERQILKALPKMAKAADNEQLKQAFQKHKEETEYQIERLQQVFEKLGTRARGQTCEAINGIIEEGEEMIGEFEKGPVLDAALAANAQAVEHYEMARYGTLVAWAKAAGQDEIAQLLEQTLEEEKRADSLLNDLAHKSLKARKAQAA